MHRPRTRRPFQFAAAGALAAGLLGGCIKYKDHTVVMPDGSGKFALTVGIKTAMLEMAEAQAKKSGEEGAMAKSPFEMDPERLQKDFEGFVAFGEPQKKTDGEWTTFTITGFFEDVNKVKMWDDKKAEEGGGRKLMVGFKFAKEGDGFVLEQTAGMFSDMADMGDTGGDDPDMTPEMKKAAAEMAKTFLKGMMGGLEFGTSVEMPGKVTKAEGHEPKEGRVAGRTLTLDDILDDEKREKLKGVKAMKVWCGAADVTAEEKKKFQDEMAAAKETWKKTLAAFEAKKAATKVEGGPVAPPPPPAPDGGKSEPK